MSKHRITPNAGFVSGLLTACRWCKGPLPPGRRTFCSGAKTRWGRGRKVITPGHGCVHQHCLRSQPPYMRRAVWDRDQGLCAIGGAACDTSRDEWQADHIIPVIEGGGECGLENMRTLCTAHHKEATKALAGRRAEARRAAKEQSPA